MRQESLFPDQPVGKPQRSTATQTANAKSGRRKQPQTSSFIPPELTAPQPNKEGSPAILDDSQTPVLFRYAPDVVVPVSELLAVYREVDQRLAQRLNQAITLAEVVEAFRAEPYGCYGKAVCGVGEFNLLQRMVQDLRSLEPRTALHQLSQVPPFFRKKLLAQITRQEQQHLLQIGKQMQGGK
jgi:hypothetical protein